VRKLIAALVVLVLLLVGADVAGRLIAQQKASQALAAKLDGDSDPSVRIHGFSFLWQAVRGDYGHVTATSNGLTLGPIHRVDAQVDLYDAALPLSDALSGNVEHLTAQRADLRAVIPGDQLAGFLQQPGMTFESAGDGMVRVHTTIAVSGRTFPIVVDIDISVTDDKLTLSARPISAAGVQIPAHIADDLKNRLTTDKIPLTALPFPLESADVAVQNGNLVLTASATKVDAQRLKWIAAG
jgi:hypothetical protein